MKLMEIYNMTSDELPEDASEQIDRQIVRLQAAQSPVAQNVLILQSKFERAVQDGNISHASQIFQEIMRLG